MAIVAFFLVSRFSISPPPPSVSSRLSLKRYFFTPRRMPVSPNGMPDQLDDHLVWVKRGISFQAGNRNRTSSVSQRNGKMIASSLSPIRFFDSIFKSSSEKLSNKKLFVPSPFFFFFYPVCSILGSRFPCYFSPSSRFRINAKRHLVSSFFGAGTKGKMEIPFRPPKRKRAFQFEERRSLVFVMMSAWWWWWWWWQPASRIFFLFIFSLSLSFSFYFWSFITHT